MTMRGRSCLATFFILLWPFALVDEINVLPMGVLLYSMGLASLVDLVYFDSREQFRIRQKRRQERRQQRKLRIIEIQRQYEAALFEYHVLMGQPEKQIVEVKHNGDTILVAI